MSMINTLIAAAPQTLPAGGYAGSIFGYKIIDVTWSLWDIIVLVIVLGIVVAFVYFFIL